MMDSVYISLITFIYITRATNILLKDNIIIEPVNTVPINPSVENSITVPVIIAMIEHNLFIPVIANYQDDKLMIL